MRHYNPHAWYSRRMCYEPWDRPYTYTRANKDRKYIKVLKFVNEHPGCSRFEIQCAVWGINPEANARDWRGWNSSLFSNLLYDDLIDYNNKYRYTITNRGRYILGKVYDD